MWKEMTQDVKFVQKNYLSILDIREATKMWRSALIIRHNCDKRKKYVGHRCSKLYPVTEY